MARTKSFYGNRIYDQISRKAILNIQDFKYYSNIMIYIQKEQHQEFMQIFKYVMLGNVVQQIEIRQCFPVNLIPFLKLFSELSQITNSLKKIKLMVAYDHQIQDQEIDLLSESFTNKTQDFIFQFGFISQQQILKLFNALKQKSQNLSYLKLKSDPNLEDAEDPQDPQDKLNIKVLEYISNFTQLKKLKLSLANQILDLNEKINLKHENCEEILLTVQQLNQIETLKYFNNLRQLSILVQNPTIQELQYCISYHLFSNQNLTTFQLILDEIKDLKTEILNQLRFSLPKLSQLTNLYIQLYTNQIMVSQIISLLKDNNQIKTFKIISSIPTQLSKEEVLNFIHLEHLNLDLIFKQDAKTFLNLENLITLRISGVQNKSNLLKLKRLVSFNSKN